MNRAEYLIRLSHGNEKMCANCKYYYEHFIKTSDSRSLSGYSMKQIDEGHCVKVRMKTVKSWKTCEHWEAKEKDERK